jgi:hypothetical protein
VTLMAPGDVDHENFVRLSEILAPGECDLMAMFEAYFDESGSHDGSAALCVAGYLFEKEQCRALDLEWKAVLDKFKLPYFRMSSCAHGNFPFNNLSKEQRIEVETQMIGIIRSHMLFGTAISVNEDEYDSWPIKSHLGTAYAYCCWQSLAAIYVWMNDNKINGDIAYFFESGHAFQTEANEVMNEIFKLPDLRAQYRYLSHAFVDKKKVRPVQTADILAWLHGNLLKRMQKDIFKPRADYSALIEGRPHKVHIANRTTMARIIAVGDLLNSGVNPANLGVRISFGPWRIWSPL